MTLLSADHVCVRFGSEEVLHDISLKIDQGEIVTILGPNGSGKSTLLRALLGIVPVAEGRILREAGLRVGYVPQKLTIDRTMPITVRRFLSLPTRVSDAAASEALARVGMAGQETEQMTTLSGGQLQRVLLARALLGKPQ
ncbi:MAG TPA: ATP-binding cassette domain-containing protein, partial [Tabrizicola sp.]|nr:ATP-binding cassette domain-containing protein [Tabrizicola sp.]